MKLSEADRDHITRMVATKQTENLEDMITRRTILILRGSDVERNRMFVSSYSAELERRRSTRIKEP